MHFFYDENEIQSTPSNEDTQPQKIIDNTLPNEAENAPKAFDSDVDASEEPLDLKDPNSNYRYNYILPINYFKPLYPKEKSCCITGHRQIFDDDVDKLTLRILSAIYECIKSDIVNFYVGGAMGFDMLAIYSIIYLKNYFPDIALTIIIPCLNFTDNWPEEQISLICDAIDIADEVYYISEDYQTGCTFERNSILIQNSSRCLAYFVDEEGGTHSTLDQAFRAGLKVINLAGVEDSPSLSDTGDKTERDAFIEALGCNLKRDDALDLLSIIADYEAGKFKSKTELDSTDIDFLRSIANDSSTNSYSKAKFVSNNGSLKSSNDFEEFDPSI